MSALNPARSAWLREIAAFVLTGCLAAVVHYGLLVSLVEGYRIAPVPASVAGYVAGGFVSYLLNRRVTYRSDRPHTEATWRFAVVAAIGLGLTWAVMSVLTGLAGLPYLVAQLATTGVVLVWNYLANKFWTFGARVAPLP